jgi:hypothetical protein
MASATRDDSHGAAVRNCELDRPACLALTGDQPPGACLPTSAPPGSAISHRPAVLSASQPGGVDAHVIEQVHW